MIFCASYRSSKIFYQKTKCVIFQKDRLNFNFEAEHYLKNGNSDVCGGAAQSGICLVTDEEESAGRLDTKHATLLSGKSPGAEKPQLETSTLGNEQHFCCFHLNNYSIFQNMF